MPKKMPAQCKHNFGFALPWLSTSLVQKKIFCELGLAVKSQSMKWCGICFFVLLGPVTMWRIHVKDMFSQHLPSICRSVRVWGFRSNINQHCGHRVLHPPFLLTENDCGFGSDPLHQLLNDFAPSSCSYHRADKTDEINHVKPHVVAFCRRPSQWHGLLIWKYY